MLYQFLDMLRFGTIRTPGDLAEQLEVSEDLILHMAEQLTQQGYLRKVSKCATSCPGCALQGVCSLRDGARLWALTTKGLAAANRK